MVGHGMRRIANGAGRCRRASGLAAPLALAAALAAGCSGEPQEDPPPAGEPVDGEEVEVQPLLHETVSGIHERRRQVLRSQEEWADFWEEAFAGRDPVPERPAVDFAERIVVVAAMGERPTGGFSVEVEEVRTTEDGLRVVVREVSPGPECIVTQAFTQPVTAVAVPDGQEEVSFEERESVREC